MDPTSACALDPRAVYETAMVRRSNDQQRVEGAEAVRLIETATAPSAARRALPPDATISIHA